MANLITLKIPWGSPSSDRPSRHISRGNAQNLIIERLQSEKQTSPSLMCPTQNVKILSRGPRMRSLGATRLVVFRGVQKLAP